MENMFCALGCSPIKNLYIFPSQTHDKERRKAWLNFFDIEEPNVDYVYACDRHFSDLQITTKGIQAAAIPDIPVICGGIISPFKRKPKNWRKNVVVVTPRDPEFVIYRHETGVFPQNLFGISDASEPPLQIPVIKSVSCSMTTQTNTRLCGLIEISDIKEEYRLNCFYCSEFFPLENWYKFVLHLKKYHFVKEEAFKMSKYLSDDHDYTSIGTPSNSPVKSSIELKTINSFVQLPPPLPVLLDPVILPPLFVKPQICSKKTLKNNYKTTESLPPPLLAKPHPVVEKPFKISLADQLINLLNETVLSRNFLNTEEDNIMIIKNTGSENIDTSTFLTNLMNSETNYISESQKLRSNAKSKNPSNTSSSKYTRPIYTKNSGQQNIPSRKYSLSYILQPPLPKNKMAKLVQKRIAQQTLKSINVFENIYKTVKTRPPKVNELEKVHLDDPNDSKLFEKEIANLTPLKRCLKRTISTATDATTNRRNSTTEIVFEYTPKDIIVTLLENMKNYPVLWEFHEHAFNKEYNKAIEELCRLINAKWSLSITLLKMRRSINRILRFYRCMMTCQSIDKFEEYFDKCAMFLPSFKDAIPTARCPYCSICFTKDSELRKHIIVRHKSLKWPFKCVNCYERFRESDEYELHKRLPHYDEIFKCEHCDKIFNRRHLYNKHVSSYKRRIELRMEAAIKKVQPVTYPHQCSVCHKTFISDSYLKNHEVYHKEKKFKCDLCPKIYYTKMGLKIHLKRHRNEKDFICEICGKGFTRKVELNAHISIHTGDIKVTCNICNLTLSKNNLLRHLRLIHVATEGTIAGTFRSKSYSYKKFLNKSGTKKRHIKDTPRQYNCKICNISFVRLKMLKDHNKEVHSDVKKMPCKICDIEFIHLQNLKRHYRCKHKLHMYQVFKLIYQNEDLNTVLSMKKEELDDIGQYELITHCQNVQNISNKFNSQQKNNDSERERIYSDEIQDEIMKAVENLDKQEIKVDDDHSMNEFFTNLLKHP